MQKNKVAILILLVLVAWGIYDFTKNNIDQKENVNQQKTHAEAVVGIKIGNKAQDFELLHMDGTPVKLSNYIGKKVILNFWATWCPPCRAEMPHMQKFYKDNEKEVVVLAVNLTNTEKNETHVINFIKDFGLTFPIVMDTEGDVASAYEIFAYPTSYIINSQGVIQKIFQGPISYEMMDKEISKIN